MIETAHKALKSMKHVHGQVMQFAGSPRLAVRCGEDVSVGDEHTAALVLGEQAEPGGLLHQHLSRKEGETRRNQEEQIKAADGGELAPATASRRTWTSSPRRSCPGPSGGAPRSPTGSPTTPWSCSVSLLWLKVLRLL